MAWIQLIAAGLLEIAWPILLKQSQGFTRLWPTTAMVGTLLISFYLLSLAVRTIPVGTGYAIWTGIGATGAAIIGMVLYNEPRTAARLACIALIIAGIVGLKLLSSTAPAAH